MIADFAQITLAGWLAITAILAFAGFMQGSLGLGFPTVATPLLVMWLDMPRAIVLILLPCLAVVIMNILLGPSLRQLFARFWFMPLGSLLGASAGGALFVTAPNAPYALVLVALIFVYLALDRLGRAESELVKRHPLPFGIAAAVTGGGFETTANVAAPPLVMYYSALGLAPAAFVQGLNLCFATGKLTQFAVLAASGMVAATQWLATLPLAAVAVVAGLAGVRARDRMDARAYRHWLKLFLLAIALVLLGQHAWRAAGL